MAKKGRHIKPPREMSRRQLSHFQRQKRRQRLIFLSGAAIIFAVVVLISAGWLLNSFLPMRQTVIRVNDTTYDMAYFIRTLQIQGGGQSQPYLQYLAPYAVRNIQSNELIRQEAAKLGFTVGSDEVRKKLSEAKLPDEPVHRDHIRVQLLLTKLRDDYFDKQVPASAAQVNALAMLLESEQQAIVARARLDAGEDFGKLAGELSLDNYTRTNQGALGWRPRDVLAQMLGSSVPGDYAFGSVAGTLSQPRYDADITKWAGYWLLKVTGKNEESQTAEVSAMLLDSEARAEKIRERLEAGEDFAALAREFSQLDGVADNGGNLGAVSQGALPQPADDFVFNADTKAGALSGPIRDTTNPTTGGYWLVMVLEKADDRPIDAADRDSLKEKAVGDWVADLWPSDNVVEDYLDDAKLAWAVNQAVE